MIGLLWWANWPWRQRLCLQSWAKLGAECPTWSTTWLTTRPTKTHNTLKQIWIEHEMSMRTRDRHDSGTIGLQRWFGGGLLNMNFERSQAFLTLSLIFRATEAAPNCWKWSIPFIRFANPTNHHVWPDATSDGRALSWQFEHLVTRERTFCQDFLAAAQKTNGSNTTEESLRKERDMFQEDVGAPSVGV